MIERKSAGKCKSVVTAGIKSLCYEARSAARGMPKHGPEGLPNPALHVSKPFKIKAPGVPGSPNAPKGRLRPTKRRPRAPSKRPRGIRDAHKNGHEPPKNAQKLAKQRPRDAKDCPGPLQSGARRVPSHVLSMNLAASYVQQAPGMISRRFLNRAPRVPCAENLAKT